MFKVYPMGKVETILPTDTTKIDAMGCSYLQYPREKKRKDIPTDPTVNFCFSNN